MASITHVFTNGTATPNGVEVGAGPSNGNGHHAYAPGSPLDAGATAPSTDFSSPPPAQNGYHAAPAQAHEAEIVNHLYHSGFQMGNYADTNLHVHTRVYRLHALILSRSPYLAHVMSTTRTNAIYIPLEEEPHITEEGFAVALGFLYSSVSLSLVSRENARSVLAAACLLGGMEALCDHAYQICRSSISVDTIEEWIPFVESLDSATTPSENGSAPDLTPSSVYGPFAKRLRDDVFAFTIGLPELLQAFHPQAAPSAENPGLETLLRVYSCLPFDFFKHAIESPSFPIASDQARFKFAKSAIARRKQAVGRDAEESVVLAFGGVGDSGSAVHITRKLKKRSLWKVTK